jgi:hypothetical protein
MDVPLNNKTRSAVGIDRLIAPDSHPTACVQRSCTIAVVFPLLGHQICSMISIQIKEPGN